MNKRCVLLSCGMILATSFTASLVVGCGSSGDDFSWPVPPNILGSWVGTFSGTDGTGSVTLTIADQGMAAMPASIDGTWSQSRAPGSGSIGVGSAIVQNASGQYAINFTVLFASGCGANAGSATLNEAGDTFTGTYGGDCSSGTFTVTRQ